MPPPCVSQRTTLLLLTISMPPTIENCATVGVGDSSPPPYTAPPRTNTDRPDCMPTPLIVTWSVESISKARLLLALNVDWLMLPAGNDSKPSVNVAPDV